MFKRIGSLLTLTVHMYVTGVMRIDPLLTMTAHMYVMGLGRMAPGRS